MRATILLLPLLAALAGGCRITPDEIARIETENELLRQQIRVIRENCEYYRALDLRVEDEPAPGSGGEAP